jgi:outer membrane protein assembly factor BamD (BamD/ComL family)
MTPHGSGAENNTTRTSRMSLRIGPLGTLLVGCGFLAGCTSVSPRPASAPNAAAAYNRPAADPDEGWLFKQAAGQQAPQSPAPPSGVVQTSAVVPATSAAPEATALPSYPVAGPGAAPASMASADSGPLLFAPSNAAATAAPPAASPPAAAPNPPSPAAASPTAASPPAAPKPKSADDDTNFEWSDLAPDVVWAKFMKSMGYGPDEAIARVQFREGEALFREKKYAEAAPKFYTASWRWPDSTLEENALFLEGECYFFDDQYGKAEDAYDALLKAHGNTRYLDTVMWRLFAIARYWEQMDALQPHWAVTANFNDKTRPWFDTWGNAIGAYESIHLHDPRGPLADSAVMAMANMYFRAGQYEDAAFRYDILRKDYPKSKYQLKAHLLGLESKMRMYQGPIYDVQALKDAAEIADQTLRQFRGRLGDEEAKVLQTRAQIVVLRAQREWIMGQYYDNKKYYAAARQYYKFLLDTYPRTSYADLARTRLEQIRNEPDSPPNHFKWLTQVFDHER